MRQCLLFSCVENIVSKPDYYSVYKKHQYGKFDGIIGTIVTNYKHLFPNGTQKHVEKCHIWSIKILSRISLRDKMLGEYFLLLMCEYRLLAVSGHWRGDFINVHS